VYRRDLPTEEDDNGHHLRRRQSVVYEDIPDGVSRATNLVQLIVTRLLATEHPSGSYFEFSGPILGINDEDTTGSDH